MLNKLDEIEALMQRATEHLMWLQHHIPHLNEDAIAMKDNSKVIAIESSYDIVFTRIRIRIGEFANSFRSVLDYLACSTVERDGGEVTARTQFPIEDSKDGFATRRKVQLKGLREDHVDLFEKFQPYNKTGNSILLLRTLSNFYKHRGLISLEKRLHQVTSLQPASKGGERGDDSGQYPETLELRSGLIFTVSFKGSNIVPQLEEICQSVRGVVDQFRPLLAERS